MTVSPSGDPTAHSPSDPHTADVARSLRDSVTALIPPLRAFARSLTRDAADADDLAQETLLRALANIHQFQPGTNLKAWLFAIMRNTHISSAKKRGRERGMMASVEPEDVGRSAGQEWSAAKTEMQVALNKLPPAQREVIVLIGGLGLSYEECAEVCGCEMGTVKSRLNRARARLATLLDAETADEVF